MSNDLSLKNKSHLSQRCLRVLYCNWASTNFGPSSFYGFQEIVRRSTSSFLDALKEGSDQLAPLFTSIVGQFICVADLYQMTSMAIVQASERNNSSNSSFHGKLDQVRRKKKRETQSHSLIVLCRFSGRCLGQGAGRGPGHAHRLPGLQLQDLNSPADLGTVLRANL